MVHEGRIKLKAETLLWSIACSVIHATKNSGGHENFVLIKNAGGGWKRGWKELNESRWAVWNGKRAFALELQ